MRYSLLAAALAAPVVLATPVKRQSTNIDPVVLQFALTLEHLENVFYKQALQKFSQSDFLAAGYGAKYYNNLKYIAADEEAHVSLLTSALSAAGATPVAACTYKFPYTDVASFITLSSILEGVGTSAYLGGAPLITSKDYLTVAGSILVTEALHTSLQRNAVNEIPFATPYGTPLDPTSVYTLAAAFIASCPSTNAALPFTPFPALTLTTVGGTCEQGNCDVSIAKRQAGVKCRQISGTAVAATATPTWSAYPMATGTTKAPALAIGASVTFTAASAIPAGSYLTFVFGLTVVSVPATISGMTAVAAIPAMDGGQTYVFITSAAAAGNKLVTSTVLFGPAILEVAPAAPSINYSQA